MEKVTTYKQLIKRIMLEYERLYNLQTVPGVEEVVVIDEERGQYLLLSIGWEDKKRVRRTTLHVRLHNDKIWIEEDWTEHGIATDLLKAGVPNHDIVLAFHPPDMRELTEFAVA